MALQLATKSDYGAAPLGTNITRDLAAFIARFRFEDLPEDAVHESRRSVLDWLGWRARGQPASDARQAACRCWRQLSGKPQATVFGHAA